MFRYLLKFTGDTNGKIFGTFASAHFMPESLRISYFDFCTEETEISLLLEVIKCAIINGIDFIEVYPLCIMPSDYEKEIKRLQSFAAVGFVETPDKIPYRCKMVYEVPKRKSV